MLSSDNSVITSYSIHYTKLYDSLLAQSTLNKKEITMELAKDMIDKLVKSTRREISIDYIQKVVCNYFSMPVDLLGSKTRKREIVQARQIAMYFAKNMTKASLRITSYNVCYTKLLRSLRILALKQKKTKDFCLRYSKKVSNLLLGKSGKNVDGIL